MVSPRSVLFILWLPSEPEREWPSGLGVAIVDVGHQASGRAVRAPTSPPPAGSPHADRVQLPETDLRAYRLASYSSGGHADVNLPGSAGAHMLYFRGFSAPCYEE